MPGKKGFGDTRKKSSESPVYKKQKFGEAKSPFTMSPLPMIQGTSPHKSALKAVDEALIAAAGELGVEPTDYSGLTEGIEAAGTTVAEAMGEDEDGDGDEVELS